jgi:hypothetical protein
MNKLSEEYIEKEVQARVEFKMNELLTGLKNRYDINWNIAFNTGNSKYHHYQEAFAEMQSMFKKELEMSTPYDHMAEQKRRIKRDEAIIKIMKRFFIGDRDYHHKEKLIVSIIEDAQFY